MTTAAFTNTVHVCRLSCGRYHCCRYEPISKFPPRATEQIAFMRRHSSTLLSVCLATAPVRARSLSLWYISSHTVYINSGKTSIIVDKSSPFTFLHIMFKPLPRKGPQTCWPFADPGFSRGIQRIQPSASKTNSDTRDCRLNAAGSARSARIPLRTPHQPGCACSTLHPYTSPLHCDHCLVPIS